MERSTYQSPLPELRPFEFPSPAALPDAAEAKLVVNGEGMLSASRGCKIKVQDASFVGSFVELYP